jgi:pathogenesis-related protein 1
MKLGIVFMGFWLYRSAWLRNLVIPAAMVTLVACSEAGGPDTLPVYIPSGAGGQTGLAGVGVSQVGAVAAAGAGTGGIATVAKGGSMAAGSGGTRPATGGRVTAGSGGKVTTGAGTGGKTGAGGAAGTAANGETGRMVGMTSAHNVVRAEVDTEPALSPLTWSPTLAAYAQEWTDTLAKTCNPQHRSSADLQKVGYGENLAMFGGTSSSGSTAQKAVNGWAGEVECYTYGKFMTGDKCDVACYTAMNSDGCGHYTAIVWRNTKEVGCGVSTCSQGGMKIDIWVCNYSPAGNYVGQVPY